MSVIQKPRKPVSFPRKLVPVSGSLKITIPKAIIRCYEYKPNETVQVYAVDENSIMIERVSKR